MGPPDHLAVDQWSSYVSKEMRQNLEASGVKLKEASIETPGSIFTVERYHAPFHCAYKKLQTSLGQDDATDAECLQMSVYSINANMGLEGLCYILLLFGGLPRPARSLASPTQQARQQVV